MSSLINNKMTLAAALKSVQPLTYKQKINLVMQLSLPAILTQVSFIMMEYIDAAMVGSMGAAASAAIGLVLSTTWLFGGMCNAASVGFSIQTAHCIGAGENDKARQMLRQGIIVTGIFSLFLAAIGMAISSYLPDWLGSGTAIKKDAIDYFFIYACSLPIYQLKNLAAMLLQSSGNMRAPSIINTVMCLLDIVFNLLFIFPSHQIMIGNISFTMPGLDMGVAGAALGTAVAEAVAAIAMLWMVCCKSPILHFLKHDKWKLTREYVYKAIKLGFPVGLEHAVLTGAIVVTTAIVAPLGAVAIATNSFAVTAESLCYMPGYGIAIAASPLVGQSIGAKRWDLTHHFARITVGMGVVIMTIMAFIMFVIAPYIFAFLTPDLAVQEIGTKILRIEMFAEPMFALSIVIAGVLRGEGDTFVPSILNICSIWCVRIPLSLLLASSLGVMGVWIAMSIELCCRGLLLFMRLWRKEWFKREDNGRHYNAI